MKGHISHVTIFTTSSTGYDLASAVDTVVPARGKAIVKTDLAIAIPENTYARIAPRSGLAVKHFIDVGAGVVDYDYRGNVGVVLFNHSDVDFPVRQNDRIAQLILEKIAMVPVEEVTELPSTARGDGGFGSTGLETVTSDADSGDVKRIKLGESLFSAAACSLPVRRFIPDTHINVVNNACYDIFPPSPHVFVMTIYFFLLYRR